MATLRKSATSRPLLISAAFAHGHRPESPIRSGQLGHFGRDGQLWQHPRSVPQAAALGVLPSGRVRLCAAWYHWNKLHIAAQALGEVSVRLV